MWILCVGRVSVWRNPTGWVILLFPCFLCTFRTNRWWGYLWRFFTSPPFSNSCDPKWQGFGVQCMFPVVLTHMPLFANCCRWRCVCVWWGDDTAWRHRDSRQAEASRGQTAQWRWEVRCAHITTLLHMFGIILSIASFADDPFALSATWWGWHHVRDLPISHFVFMFHPRVYLTSHRYSVLCVGFIHANSLIWHSP